jgi:dTDP-4-amino-4,6-dideoxygalactose transaminase
MEISVPFVNLGLQYAQVREEVLGAFDRLSSNGAYIMGPELEQFEQEFASYCGVKYAVGVGNGGEALLFSLLALGIGKGDEVITAPNSFVATAWAIANTGAKPVFVDVGDDYNINSELIEQAITSATRAIMPVHLTGKVADMRRIMEIAVGNNLQVVEDAAQAVGATYYGQKAGSFGDLGCFSLHPLKNLHVHGDGGMIVTSDKSKYEYLQKIRNHGLVNRDSCEFWGYNSRLDNIQAAIGSIKLKYLDQWNDRYRAIASMYTTGILRNENLKLPDEKDYEKPVYHRYVITSPLREKLQSFLLEKGIESKINYPIPLHLQKAAKQYDYKKGDFPVTERLASEILSLPLYPEMTNKQVEFVIETVNDFFQLSAKP